MIAQRWIVQSFVPATGRVAHYVAVDLPPHATREQSAEAGWSTWAVPVVGTLVEHLVDEQRGVVDSRVVWGVVSEVTSTQIVAVDDSSEDCENVILIGVYAEDAGPSQHVIDSTVAILRQHLTACAGSWPARRRAA